MYAATAWKFSSGSRRITDHQDEHHTLGEELQKVTDAHIRDIDHALQAKEQEIMQV